MKYYLAIDIGASSGRHIIGWKEKGEIKTQEVFRFPNSMREQDGHLTWDLDALLNNIRDGINTAKIKYPKLESLSIDTWGVDYVLLQEDKEVLPCYAYRDRRTASNIAKMHKLIPFSTLYSHTGCQFQPFNSIYQLYTDKVNGRLKDVTDFLMMPEYLLWKLTGIKVKEFTNATTTGLVNAKTGEFDTEIIKAFDLPAQLFPKLTQAGTVIGQYEGIKVVLCATHDTASAVEGIPMEENNPYISSGTWSLLGVKTPKPITDIKGQEANYSNEGGLGYNRYQKNIMGMWLVNELQKEICRGLGFSGIVQAAQESKTEALVDTNAPEFLAPVSMKEAFDKATGGTLVSVGDYFRCAYRSLALSYKVALEELEKNTGTHYQKLYIVGGGAKNQYLNTLTAEMTGKEVIALPIEATAIGNLKVQMEIEK